MPGVSMIRALWAYRGFVWSSVLREFHGKYRESLLGACWSVANPLTLIVIYTVVFGQLMRHTLPGHEQTPFAFSIYLCAGVTSWNLFADMLSRLNGVFIQHGNLIKKASFPRVCLPAIATLSALINFGIVLGLFLAFLALIGHWPGWPLLAVLPLLALQLLFTLGLGVFLGTLNVFFRDVGQLTTVALQFWFWLTPIVYTMQALPERVRSLLAFNPMQPLVSAYQQIFLDQSWPAVGPLLPLAALTLVVLVLGGSFFLARVGELVDEL
ncbi:ABC transporter [Comamonas serinivorans]|uniref:Transport permease protein n=1 Tax=Comamonas serinivorans TaxID=1082851 RepID=A0A1Y0EJP2_9BURK|nr:ABC transporter permease [Comamonas serinivorans]ARU03648.1 ABC transporter [Comamonas serinivorans]